MPYNSLLDIEIKPLTSIEEREEVKSACEKWGVYPIWITHAVYKKGDVIGAFCTSSPTVFWWMRPDMRGRESLLCFQSCDTLMTQQGYDTYIIPCEQESPYYKLLSNKLDYIPSIEGNDWRLFLNKSY